MNSMRQQETSLHSRHNEKVNENDIIHIARNKIVPIKPIAATLKYQLYARTLSGQSGKRQTAMAPSTEKYEA